MARVFSILRALRRDLARDQRSPSRVVGNNFFIATAVFLQKAGVFPYLLIGLVALFPLSADPLQRMPRSRSALWPLGKGEWVALRAVSPWLSPASWLVGVAAILVMYGRMTRELWLGVGGAVTLAALASHATMPLTQTVGRFVPGFPGPWGYLIRKDIREMLATLDFYCAALLSAAAVGFRIGYRDLPEESCLPLTILVAVALSSYAQRLFGLDGDAGLARYRLLPVRGWKILAAKSLAFLLVVLVLTLPLAPLAGATAAVVALTLGYGPSVLHSGRQMRWRFSTGSSLLSGVFQTALMTMAAAGVALASQLIFLPCLVACMGSAVYYGRKLDLVPRA